MNELSQITHAFHCFQKPEIIFEITEITENHLDLNEIK